MSKFNPSKRIFSFGGGVQSVAVMVLQAQNKIEPFDHFIFANVGDKAENPATLAYISDYAAPYAAKHGIDLVTVQRTIRGEPVDLYDYTLSDNRTIPIPIVFPSQGFGNRTCTIDWKVRAVSKWIRTRYGFAPMEHLSHALTYEILGLPLADLPQPELTQIELGIGFSSDEQYRMAKKPDFWHDHEMCRDKTGTWNANDALGYSQRYIFPLAHINRQKCMEIIQQAGLPVPPKSSCWFCPFKSRTEWIEQRRKHGLEDAINFQDALNAKYQRIRAGSKHRVERIAIHQDGIDLRLVPDQATLWEQFADADSECETGYCGL